MWNFFSIYALVSLICNGAAYMYVAPTIPFIFEARGYRQFWSGIILGVNDISVWLFPMIGMPILEKYYNIENKIVYYQSVFMCILLCMLPILHNCESESCTVTLFIALRLTQGIFSSLLYTINLNLALRTIPEEKIEIYIAAYEAAFTFGTCFSGWMGGPLYKAFGYDVAYGAEAAVFLLLIPFSICALRVYNKITEGEDHGNHGSTEDVSIWTYVFNPRKYMFIYMPGIGLISYCSYIPFYGYYLEHEYGFSIYEASLYIIIISFAYSGTGIIYLLLGENTNVLSKVSNLTLMIAGGFICVMGTLLVGPINGIPENSAIIGLACAFAGVGCLIMVVPVIPECHRINEKIYEGKQLDAMNDKATAFYVSQIGMGSCIGPLLFSAIVPNCGFKNSTLIVAILVFIYTFMVLTAQKRY